MCTNAHNCAIFGPRQRAGSSGDKSDESRPPAHDAHGDRETLQPASILIRRVFLGGRVTHGGDCSLRVRNRESHAEQENDYA